MLTGSNMRVHSKRIVQAYEALHRAGIYKEPFYNSSDGEVVRPGNVLVRPDGRPCIIDFARAEWHKCNIKGTIELEDPRSVSVTCEEVNEIMTAVDAFERGQLSVRYHDVSLVLTGPCNSQDGSNS